MSTFDKVFKLTGGLVGALGNVQLPFGLGTLEEQVANLLPSAWFDATETYAKSKIAVDLNGSSQYFEVDHADLRFGDEDFTVMSVFKHDTVAGSIDVVSARWKVSTNNTSYYMGIDGNQGIFTIDADGVSGGSTTLSHASTLSSGTWYFSFYIHDATANTIKIKIYDTSGNEVGVTASTSHTGGAYVGTEPTLVGALDSVTQGNHWDGDIDQNAYFRKALSDAEITTLVGGGAGLTHKDLDGTETFHNNIVAWYDFNMPTNFGKDYNGQSHAVSLDGNLDYFSIANADATSFDKERTDSFSGGAWVRFTATGGEAIMSKQEGSTTFRGWLFNKTGSETIALQLFSDNATTNYLYVESNTAVSLNQWYHLAFTYNGSSNASGVKIYINGVDDTNSTPVQDTLSATIDGTADFNIGRRAGNNDLYFTGKVDEAFMYSGVLNETTHSEVSTLHNGGTVAEASTLLTTGSDATNPASLVSSWSFDEDLANIGSDKYGSNDLTPNSIAEADLVGGVKDARTQYADIDDVGEFFERLNASNLALGAGNPITIFSIVTFKNTGGARGLFYLFDGASPTALNLEYYLTMGSSENFAFIAWNDDQTTTTYIGKTTTTTFSDGDIVAIAATYDGGNLESGIELYACNFTAGETAMTLMATSSNTANEVGFTGVAGSSTSRHWIAKGTGAINPNSKLTMWNQYVLNAELSKTQLDDLVSYGTSLNYSSLSGSEDYYGNFLVAYDFENSADLGADSFSTNDLTVNGTPTVGSARETSLDLTETSISSSNVATGHVEGKASGYTGVTLWTDRSTNGNNATQTTLANVPTWIENVLNSTEDVVRFNGTDEFISSTDSDFAFGADEVADTDHSWTWLVNPASLTNAIPLANKATNASSCQYSHLILTNGGIRFQFFDLNTSNYIFIASDTQPISTGSWYHIALTYDASEGVSGMKMYLNGSELASSPTTLGSYTAMHNVSTFAIGKDQINTLYGAFDMAQGKAFSGKTLSATEVSLINDYYNEKYGLSLT